MKLCLIRHAQTGDQYKNRYIGSTNIPISEKGFAQAGQLAQRLPSFDNVSCYCSPLLRCQQTAEIIKKEQRCDIQIEVDLSEVDFGRWEGATFDEICKSDPEMVDQWSDNVLEFAFPDGEHNQQFFNRVRTQLDKLLSYKNDTVMVVSHGGVIRVMICTLLGMSFDKYLLFDVKPARYTEFEVFGKSAVLSGFNL